MTMTWTGRQLTTLTQNGKQNTYKYDVDGLRLEKTAGGVTTQYQYVNGQLLGEKEDAEECGQLRCTRAPLSLRACPTVIVGAESGAILHSEKGARGSE